MGSSPHSPKTIHRIRSYCFKIVRKNISKHRRAELKRSSPLFCTEQVSDALTTPYRQRYTATGGRLGLAIVNSICATHGGTIEVESAEGQGSRLKVELPKAPG